MNIILREAACSDAELLFRWANDPEVRKMSFSTDLIEWEDHKLWFDKQLADPNVFIFIATKRDGTPIGQVRFEPARDLGVETDIHVEPKLKGQGLGSKILQKAVTRLFEISAVDSIYATIKSSNPASLSAFKHVGFEMFGEEVVYGEKCYRLILHKR